MSVAKIASWNVNSLRVRLPHVLDWLEQHQPDMLALQETKTVDENFPVEEIREAGYYVEYSGQKTYNGVAIISRLPAEAVVRGFPGYEDPQRRVLAATYNNIRLINLYIPNGNAVGTEKYQYKLEWLEQLDIFIRESMAAFQRVVIVGDFNIAPDDRDVHDPHAWAGKVLCSVPEREAFTRLLDQGLVDTFRLFDQDENSFSWWDYRMNGFRRNRGLRIDLILASCALGKQCIASVIDTAPRKLERPSDHAPVMATFNTD